MALTGAVTSYAIDQDASAFAITLRPGPPGLRIEVGGIDGCFDATITANGTVDLDAPLAGRFEVDVEQLDLGNRLLTFGARRFLSSGNDHTGERATVVGELVEARSTDGRHFDADLVLRVRGREVPVTGTCTFDAGVVGALRVTGEATCDPRALGVALPPLVHPTAHVRWDLRLAAVPATVAGAA